MATHKPSFYEYRRNEIKCLPIIPAILYFNIYTCALLKLMRTLLWDEKNKTYRLSLHQQVYNRLTDMQAFGESKQLAKTDGSMQEKNIQL